MYCPAKKGDGVKTTVVSLESYASEEHTGQGLQVTVNESSCNVSEDSGAGLLSSNNSNISTSL